jgi:CheY-like chemotaxis protein
VFEPFFTTKGEHGSGLGLSMVQKVVASHAGRVAVTSTPEAGTTFTVWLPTTEAPLEDEAASSEALPGRVARVVLIDDQRDVLDTAAMMLRADGHDVRVFLDPIAAVASVVADRPDLVISDLGMPGMNGWDVARRVHEAHPGLPVVLLTGWGREITAAQIREGGIAAVIPKPVETPALRAVIARVLAAEERALRMLLVDDSAAFASVLAMLIGQAGHEVMRVETGTAALAALRDGAFDLVITDVHLPDLAAGGVVAAARSAPGSPAVCVTSGSAVGEMGRDAPGADLYVEKVRLAERLEELVRLARARTRR